jgi:23S rRNA pseudouridine2605 synthase
MERLQKVIARAGVASRRAAEEIILAGRVRVNGRVVTELGAKADPYKDKIEVDGKRLVSETSVYLVFHKPRNVVSTLSDPEGRPSVMEYLRDVGARVYPVGRLDFATSGVLLVTNDGDFANGLLHPRGGVPKTYVVKVQGLMTDEDLQRWATGVKLEDGMTLPADVRLLRHEEDKTWFEISIREGRNQQIRRMGEATGFRVMRLARTSFAGVTSEGLRPGESRPLTVDELMDLRERFGVPKRVRRAVDQGRGRPAKAGPPHARSAAPAQHARSAAPAQHARSAAPRAGGSASADRSRSARTGRSETTPRGAGPRASRARERGDR